MPVIFCLLAALQEGRVILKADDFETRHRETSREGAVRHEYVGDTPYTGGGERYDYFFHPKPTHLTQGRDVRKAGSVGWYHARRYVPHGEWASPVLPFADFVCVYGAGRCAEMFRRQLPLEGRHVRAVAFFAMT